MSSTPDKPATGDIVVSKRYVSILKTIIGVAVPIAVAGVLGYLAQRDQDTRTLVAVDANTKAVSDLATAVKDQSEALNGAAQIVKANERLLNERTQRFQAIERRLDALEARRR